MPAFGYLLVSLARILDTLLSIYIWIVIIRAVLSWINPDPYNPIVRFIVRLVDPVTWRLSRYVPARVGMVDISPMLLIILIVLIQRIVVPAIFDAGFQMR